MSRLSEEQRKDMKIKIVLGSFFAVLIAIFWFVGPGVGYWLDKARKQPKASWAPKYFYRVALIYENTWRAAKAQDTYDEFYLRYGGKDWLDQENFEEAAEALGLQDEEFVYYFPWVMEKYDGLPGVDEDDDEIKNRRPDSYNTKPDKNFGKVIVARLKFWEGEKKYWYSRHLIKILLHMYPPGSWEFQEGEQAHRRDAMRSF